MEIQEASAGVDHQLPWHHHTPTHLAAKESTGGPGGNSVDPTQDLAQEVGATSKYTSKHRNLTRRAKLNNFDGF